MPPRQPHEGCADQACGMDEAWAQARSLAQRQRWLLTAEQARAAGLTRHQVDTQVETGRWVALRRGVYLLDADMYDAVPEDLWWRAALLEHGPDACLVGCTGARAHGAQGLPSANAEVNVAVVGGISRPPRTIEMPGKPVDGPLVVIRQWPVRCDEVVIVDGLRVRAADLCLVDAALQLDRAHALCLFDWGLHAGVLTQESLGALISRAAHRPGIRHTREAAGFADGRAQSPLESRVRLACIDGAVAPDDLQYEVRDKWERVVAVGDLAWWRKRHRPLIAEADGKVHALPAAVYHDRRRGNALTVQSCDVVRFTWADALRPIHVQQVVRAALAA